MYNNIYNQVIKTAASILIRDNSVTKQRRAELKSLKGANNIVKRAKYAIFHQNAELILFAFPSRSKPIENTLKVLSIKGIHGYYYFEDEHGYQSF